MKRVRMGIIASIGALLTACGPLQTEAELETAAVVSLRHSGIVKLSRSRG